MSKFSMFYDRLSLEPYWKRLKDFAPIAYWMLDDLFDIAADHSTYGNNGLFGSAITKGQDGIGDGHSSVYFDGTANSYVDIESTGFVAAFNGNRGSFSAWLKVDNAGIWTDGAVRHIAYFFVDGNNYITIYKSNLNNRIIASYRSAGGAVQQLSATGLSTTGWFHLGFNWQNTTNTTELFIDGVSVDTGTASGAAWAGALITTTLGINGVGGANHWHGYMQHAMVSSSYIISDDKFETIMDIVAETDLVDGELEPYSADELHYVINKVHGSCVIPNDLTISTNPLNVYNTGVGTVYVGVGEALVNGAYYVNDVAKILNLTSNGAGNPRLDYVVVERDPLNQTVRLAVELGTAAAAPVFPTLTDDQLPLAWLYIPAGFNAGVDTLSTKDVHDVRVFSMLGQYMPYQFSTNLMRNSEHCAYSDTVSPAPPDGWVTIGIPVTVQRVAPPNEQPRGWGVQVIGNNAGSGIFTRIPSTDFPTSARYFLVKGIIVPTAGGATRVTVTAEYPIGVVLYTIAKRFTPDLPAEAHEFQIVVNGLNYITIQVEPDAAVAGTAATLGQVLLCSDLYPGHYRYKHEILMFDNALTDAAWTATAKSTGVTTIDLTASFSGAIPAYARAIIIRMKMRDSGSAAGTAQLYCYHAQATARQNTAVLDISGTVNDKWRDVVGYVGLEQISATPKFKADVVATGAGTADVTIEIIGIIT